MIAARQRQPPPTSKGGDAGGAGWRDKRVSTEECSRAVLPNCRQHYVAPQTLLDDWSL